MLVEKRKFNGGLDGDTSQRELPDNVMLNCMNSRMAVTEFGRDTRVENIPGTTFIPNNKRPPYGSGKNIGSVPYSKGTNERIIFFEYNTFGDHGIYCYEITTGTMYAVLYDSQTAAGLNFSATSRINRNARVLWDDVYFTDDNNEPQCVNIEAGIKLNQTGYVTTVEPYATPIPYTTLTLIKRPPIYRLSAIKGVAGAINNYVKDGAFQFAYFYEYKNYQQSALSTFSALVPYNQSGSTNDSVTVSIPFAEHIDDYVLKVYLCVRYGNFGKMEYFKVWDKGLAADLAAINLHNAGTTQLSYIYLNDIKGVALDDIFSNTSADNVPLQSRTIERSKNRLFLGNNRSGYNTPLSTSLSLSLTTSTTNSTGSWNGQWGYIILTANLTGTIQNTYYYPFVQITSGSPPAGQTLMYFSNARVSSVWNGGIFPADLKTTENLSDAIIRVSTEADLITALKATQYPSVSSGVVIGNPVWLAGYSIFYNSFGGASAMTVINYTVNSLTNFIKSGGVYSVSIAFYDRFKRKCGIVNMPQKIVVPYRTKPQTVFDSTIQWALNNNNTLVEIPEFAYYYQIYITKNLKTRFFLQATATTAAYVTKKSDGTLDYSATTVTTSQYATALDLGTLTDFGLGYTFNEGDEIVIFGNGLPTILNVIGTDGKWVIFQPTDLGTVGAGIVNVLYEIYTPYIPGLIEPYYATGEIYNINNPGTASRTYSVLTDVINGDVYALQRQLNSITSYIVEAMSPNDKEWQYWQTDTGWVNYVDYLGQKTKTTNIVFSDVFIPGTKVNGLNKFNPFNERDIGSESGVIQKLQIANKTQEMGTGVVMLIVCNSDMLTAYLGEQQLLSTNANAYVAESTSVIGTINPLRANYGTQNPETIVEYLGLVFGMDVFNSVFWQYSDNGVVPVSRYKMSRFFKRYSKDYLLANANNLDNINGFHHIPTCIDPFHIEMLVTLPALIYENYADVLPSYSSVPSYATSIINRFDIYDKLKKTLTFKFEDNKWGSDFEGFGEWMEYSQNQLFGWKNGQMYEHNTDTTHWNRFYGTSYPVRICVTGNLNPSEVKDLFNIAIEGDGTIPNYVMALTAVPNQQITDLASTDDQWANNESVCDATFLTDRLSPNTSGTADEKLFKGDLLKDYAIFVMAEWQVYDRLFYCQYINIGYDQSKGQKNITNTINK